MSSKFSRGELVGFGDPRLQEKARQTIGKKYGVTNSSQVPHVRAKIEKTLEARFGGRSPFSSAAVREKVKETNLQRYGVENPAQSSAIQNKIQGTMIDRYGAPNAMQVPEIQLRQMASLFCNYGVTSPLMNEAILIKQRKAINEKYGVSNPALIPEVRRESRRRNLRISDSHFRQFVEQDPKRTVLEIAQHFGYSSVASVYRRVRDLELQSFIDYSIPLINVCWQALIKNELGVELNFEGHIFSDPRARCDLFLESAKVALEINPTISHSTQKVHVLFEPKPTRYHQLRSLDAAENGWTLIQVYDWTPTMEIISILRNLMGLNREKYYARKCVVIQPQRNEVVDFLSKNHIQGSAALGNIFYGLSFNGSLVQVMTFGRERFRGGTGFELIRMASQGNVVGGASKLFTAFVSDYSPDRVKAFASLDHGAGSVYFKMNFSSTGLAGLNALYSKPFTQEAYKVTQCSQKFKTEYTKLGISQQEYMNSLGFYRINDAGNRIYVWTPPTPLDSAIHG